MNNQQSSLLGFLKKKTLFKQSPVRYPGKRSRSKSRDSIIRKVTDRDAFQQQAPPTSLHHSHSERQYKLNTPQIHQNNYFQKEFQPITHETNSFKKGSRLDQIQNNLSKSKNPEESYDFSTIEKGNKFLNGLVNYASSFEAARLESAQCLQSLSLKLNTEVSNINYRIDQFRNNMSKVLHNELKALRENILRLVDEAFKESERSVRQYMRIEEQKLASDLLNMREILEKEYVRVETMREEIHKPNWRKVTGQILATELEKNLEELLKKSSQTEIKRWEMKNLSGQRMKTLEMEIRDLVRLKE